MSRALDQFFNQFHVSIGRARMLHVLWKHLSKKAVGIDASDLLRAEIVFAVSALDLYIHDIVRAGILEIVDGRRKRAGRFEKFEVSISVALPEMSQAERMGSLDAEVRRRLGQKTLSGSAQIAEFVRFFSAVQLWQNVAKDMSQTPGEIQRELDLIVKRRNEIVHEMDIRPGTFEPSAISDKDAQDAVDFIERVCRSIHNAIRNETGV